MLFSHQSPIISIILLIPLILNVKQNQTIYVLFHKYNPKAYLAHLYRQIPGKEQPIFYLHCRWLSINKAARIRSAGARSWRWFFDGWLSSQVGLPRDAELRVTTAYGTHYDCIHSTNCSSSLRCMYSTYSCRMLAGLVAHIATPVWEPQAHLHSVSVRALLECRQRSPIYHISEALSLDVANDIE